jgi:hypothetical protein
MIKVSQSFYNSLVKQDKSISKYLNVKQKIDNIWFDSKKEANRYSELKLLSRGGEVKDLKTHPKFKIHDEFRDWEGKHYLPVYYKADFEYSEKKKVKDCWKWIKTIEDVKGMKTAVYLLKKKLFLAKYKQYQFKQT